MKKFLPLILLFVGILVVAGAFLFVKSKKLQAPEEAEETALIEVDLKDRPVVSLTPTEDGHYLNLKIDKIKIPGAESLDYELLYKTGTGITQGVPGTVDVSQRDSFEADLLLGSESSGKFRYDEGVEEGTLTLRFRNDKGKLLVKFETNFHLQTDTQEMTSLDGKFTYTRADKDMNNDYWVTMETVGVPKYPNREIVSGPYGVFSSTSTREPGFAKFDVGVEYLRYSGDDWMNVRNTPVAGPPSDDIGIFVAVGE